MMQWSDIPGWSCAGIRALYDEIAAETYSGTIVELGVAYGQSLAYLAKRGRPAVRVVGVDLWHEFCGFDNLPADTIEFIRTLGTPMDACKHYLRECGVLDRVELIQGNTESAASQFADGSCALVFIDANHTLEGVRADIKGWRSKVRKSGVLAGHDYSWDMFPGVIQAVCEAFGMKRRTLDGVVWRVEGSEL